MKAIEKDKLFVYGTLLEEYDNVYSRLLKNNSCCLGEGEMKGVLYEIDKYPGAIASTNSTSWVKGKVFRLEGDVNKLFQELDQYEEVKQETGEYVRCLVEIKMKHGTEICWVYLYNWPVDNCQLIPSGCYASFMKSFD